MAQKTILFEDKTLVIMKIKVRFILHRPSYQQPLGGNTRVPAISQNTLSVKVTGDILAGLLNGILEAEGIVFQTLTGYSPRTNEITVTGSLPNEHTDRKIRDLEKKGWKFDKDWLKARRKL